MFLKKLILVISLILIPSVCFGVAATMYVTPAGALNKDGTDWDNAFGLSEWETDMENNAEAGDIYYVLGGTYIFSSTILSVKSGTEAAPIQVIGVTSATTVEPPTVADYAFGTDRPLFTMGAYYLEVDNYWIIKNIRFTTTAAWGMRVDNSGVLLNVKGEQEHASFLQAAFFVYSGKNRIINCEGIAEKGYAFKVDTANYGTFINCYAHDSKVGFYVGSYGYEMLRCIVDTCLTGMGGIRTKFINEAVIVNCTIGVDFGGDGGCSTINSIITENATGVSNTAAKATCFLDYNDWYNNDTDATNATQGLNKITDNPLLECSVERNTDGATDGAGTAFTAASNPFSDVTTDDCLIIHTAGTGATLAVYQVVAAVSAGEITLHRSAGANKSGIGYGIVKGADFTLGSGSPCLDAGKQPDTDLGLTGDYKINMGVDQDDVTAAGGGGAQGVFFID